MALDDLMAALNATSKNTRSSNALLQSRDALSQFQFAPSRKERETGKVDWKKDLMGKMGMAILGGVLGGYGEKQVREEEQGRSLRFTNALRSADPAAMLGADPELSQFAMPLQMAQYNRGIAKQDAQEQMNMKTDAELRLKGIVPGADGQGYTTDPNISEALVNQALAEKGKTPRGFGGEQSSVAAPKPMSPYNFGDRVPSVDDKLIAYQQKLTANGWDDEQASKRAGELVKGERDYAAKSFKKMDEAREKAGLLKSLADTASAGAETAGYTGPYNSLATMGANVASFFGNEEQSNKLAGQALLDSIKPDMVKASRSPGAVSDKENVMYLAAGPNSGNTPEQNAVLINKMRNLSQLEAEYADFLDTYTAEKGTSVGADRLWQNYTRQYPLFSPPTPKGTIDINQQRPSWQDFFSGQGQQAPAMPQQNTGGGPPPGLTFQEFQAWKRGQR